MPQTKGESSRTKGLKDREGRPVLKEEQEDEVNKLREHALLQSESEERLHSQSADKTARTHFLQFAFQSPRLTQNRPSVLCSTSLLPLGHSIFPQCPPKEHDVVVKSRVRDSEYNSGHVLARSNQHRALSSQSNSLVQPEVISSLFVNGRCRWPGCDEALEDYSDFLKHLNNGHSCGEKTLAQWRIQQERVRHMETQLCQEKQKLYAMQLHLRLSENLSAHPRALLSRFPSEEPDGGVEWASDTPGRQEHWPTLTPHLLSDFVNSMECYKYVNIRPPYTYAFLIRWSILEAPDKQRALNDIYNWFIRMFFYFRHNTPTWKNAVRHNLSLHKCFVRVDGSKGAVWTVDEREFQKRKGQKFTRDSTLKWLSFSHTSQGP